MWPGGGGKRGGGLWKVDEHVTVVRLVSRFGGGGGGVRLLFRVHSHNYNYTNHVYDLNTKIKSLFMA